MARVYIERSNEFQGEIHSVEYIVDNKCLTTGTFSQSFIDVLPGKRVFECHIYCKHSTNHPLAFVYYVGRGPRIIFPIDEDKSYTWTVVVGQAENFGKTPGHSIARGIRSLFGGSTFDPGNPWTWPERVSAFMSER